MASNLDKWLNQNEETLTKDLEAAKKGGFIDFDDGTYVGLITKHHFKEDKNGKPGILTQFLCLESEDPKFVGETRTDWQDLTRDEAMKYAGWRMKACGVDIGDPSEIFAEMRTNAEDMFSLAANKTVVKFVLSTSKSKNDQNKEFQNLTVKKVLEDYDLSGLDEDEISGAGGGSEDEDKQEPEGEGEEGPTAQVGMQVIFRLDVPGAFVTWEHTEGKGKNKVTTTKTGVVTDVDAENEVLSVKVEAEQDPYELEFSEVGELQREGVITDINAEAGILTVRETDGEDITDHTVSGDQVTGIKQEKAV